MTVGAELEWADVDRRAAVPKELASWNTADYTIVNSDGHANDPTGAHWPFGGELNTVATETSAEQGAIVRLLAEQLRPAINYRCNLHIHVRPDVDLTGDVAALKRVAAFIRDAEPFVYSVVEHVPKPRREDCPTDEWYAGAMKRYKRRLVSHQYRLPLGRWIELVCAETAEQVLEAHAPPTKHNRRNWAIAPRPGINLRSLWKHGTIEFRHFPGSADPEEVASCAEWALRFTEAAIAGAPTAPVLLARGRWRFPEFRPYDHQLELGYVATSYRPPTEGRVRVHREHQPVGRGRAARAVTGGVGGQERRFEWGDEPADG